MTKLSDSAKKKRDELADKISYVYEQDGFIDGFDAGYEVGCDEMNQQVQLLEDALKFYRGGDDDETAWLNPDNYVPYWTLWNDGDCVGGKVAEQVLESLAKMRGGNE
jgi:hypothetical protein